MFQYLQKQVVGRAKVYPLQSLGGKLSPRSSAGVPGL